MKDEKIEEEAENENVRETREREERRAGVRRSNEMGNVHKKIEPFMKH